MNVKWSSKWAVGCGNEVSLNFIKRASNLITIELRGELKIIFKVFLLVIVHFVQGTREPGLYILDCLFSVLVIGSLVVFVWRGLWCSPFLISYVSWLIFAYVGLWVLLDLKLFPGDVKTSAWASLVSSTSIIKWNNSWPFVWSQPRKQVDFKEAKIKVQNKSLCLCGSTYDATVISAYQAVKHDKCMRLYDNTFRAINLILY